MLNERHAGARALAITACIALSWPGSPPSHAESAERIRFHVLAVEETHSTRNVLSEATIDGPPGTDFEIELRGGRFKMTARFLTDAVVSGRLAVKAKLDTRRLHGYSERGLPLYEEDAQIHDLTLDLQEQIILLPFGSPTGDERLKIEITPTVRARVEGEAPDLEIDILEQPQDGSVNIRAFRLPHRFALSAVLLRDGVEVARGDGQCVLEDAATIRLRATESAMQADRRPLDVLLGVSQVLRDRPTDLVAFDYRMGAERGSGVAPLGVPIEFEVADPGDPGRRNHVLRLTVRAAELD